jgi:MFS family permease
MRSAILPVSALLFGTAILLLGNGLYGILLAVRAAGEGFSASTVGIVMGAYYVGFLLGCLYVPRLINGVGHIRTYTALTAIAAASSLVHVLIVDPVAWGIIRVFYGFALAGLFMVVESWLNDISASNTRGRVFSVYMIINMAALGFGQLLLLTADSRSFVLFCMISILISLAAVPLSLGCRTSPPFGKTERLTVAGLWRISPLGLVACACVGLAQGAFWSLAPVFTSDSGLDENGTTIFMSCVVFGGLLMQWPIGWLSDRYDRRSVICVVCALAAIVAAAVAYSADRAWNGALYPLAVAYGGLSMTVYALAVSHANDNSGQTGIVSLSASLLLVYAVGAIVGPLVSGGLMDATAPSALYGLIAAVFLGVAAFAIWRLAHRPAMALEDRSPFVSLARAGPVAATTDPRVDETDTPPHTP